MPIGLQLIGSPLADVKLLRAAQAFERATDFHKQRPALLNAGK
jgi:aspartyl-tRNA(Asn)/glutamyl-tRNA(Gln) amidotransferase subunit A